MEILKNVKNFFSGDISKKIFEEIWAYFEFHGEINKYFVEGFNCEPNNYEQEIYIVDYNWIKSWKRYSNYENVISMGKNYDFLKQNGYLEYNEKPNFGGLKSGRAYELFMSKTVFKIEDFDCLIDKATYDYFKKYKDLYVPILDNIHNNLYSINCIFFEDMFALLNMKGNRIKIIYKYQVQSSLELFQFDLSFKPLENNNNCFEMNDYFPNLNISEPSDCYKFKENCLKNENERKKLLKDLSSKSGVEKLSIKKYECIVSNLLLFKKNISNINNNNYALSLNNLYNHRLIGLQNIGATCYMNATLQCLVNLKQFTIYLLNKNNFFYILQKLDVCEIIGTYCKLLEKLCCDMNVINYYAPEEFKNIISLKNPLFEGIQANDSKDLIYFLLEQMNYELNQANLKINPNLQKKENQVLTNQTDKNVELTNFIQEYSSENNNIIPKLFFSLIENETICLGCNTHKFNYQIVFSLEMPLENIYSQIYGNQNMFQNNRKLNLIECISKYNEKSNFTGENAMYCNICQNQMNSTYIKSLHSLSPYLIIILNRGKGNQFQCDVDFPQEINFQQYILNPQFNYEYNLVGVVSHFGTSDMGGHFIAYCKHRTLNEWYCYNDASVTRLNDQMNGYKNGIPYILFYESKHGDKNILFDFFGNNCQNINNINNINNSNNINNMMFGNNQIQNFPMNGMPMNNMFFNYNNNMNQNNFNNNSMNMMNFGNNMNSFQNPMNNNMNNINGFNNNIQSFNNNININPMQNQQMNMNNNIM